MKLLTFTTNFNQIIGLVFSLLYCYQVAYLVIGLLRGHRRDLSVPGRLHRYAVLISARNEEGVIGELIASLKKQNYPAELLDIYVVADNCTDATARVAQQAGATVFRRFDRVEVGKGYALDFLLKALAQQGLGNRYEGYFIFDADNIVDPNFVSEMNRTFDRGGYAALTCYRNSKNFAQNWITAGYSIWFLREARFVNTARQALGLTCHVSGTGFLLSADVVRENGGWPFHLLTEDIQFSAQCAIEGRRIGYCEGAVVYDEQPPCFRQSWDQRLRWSKGFFQVCRKCGLGLFKGIFRGGRQGIACYDILMLVAPGAILTLLGGASNLAVLVSCLMVTDFEAKLILVSFVGTLWAWFRSFYLGMFLYGALTVVSEWNHIRAKAWQKLIYLPFFPIFMFTYLPITVCALFQKVEWRPIAHRSLRQLDRAA